MLRKLCLLLVLAACGGFLFAQGNGNGNGNGNGQGGPPDHVQVPIQNPHYVDARNENIWCITDRLWMDRRQKMGKSSFSNKAACPTEGGCDIPANRDATPLTSKTIRVIAHVLRNNSGGNGISQATVNASIAQMNADYAGTGFDFQLEATRFHNNSSYACIRAYSPFSNGWFNDIQNMKATYSENPGQNLNIFFSCQASSSFGTLLGIATFPWDPAALTSTGGLWVNNIAAGSGSKTLTHEVGHNLGLWHTHHGVSEVNDCSACYEYANGFEGDIRGDFASDTPPTPTNYNCSGPGGSDCQGTAWGATQPENFMGYGPDSCQTLFTNQQTSRMHCWSDSVLSGWFVTGGGGNNPPTSSFTANTTDLTVNLDGSGSSDSDGSIVTYDWAYGDGNTGSGVTASHTYASAGTYTVTLTVTDNDGASDQSSQNVTVTAPSGGNNPPVASFTVNTTDLNASFDGNGSSDSDGTITSYAWSFGDGNTGSGATASNTYASAGTYTVTLTVTDNDGATDSTSQSVTVTDPPVNNPPVASFTVSTTDLDASFDGSGSSDSDGTISSYAWNFGDGNTGSGVTTSHTYASAGTYTATLTVTDNDGATDSTSQSVTVTDPPVSNITLTGTAGTFFGFHRPILNWSGASGSQVQIYRNGSLIATTANDGNWSQLIWARGSATYNYQVCETSGGACSNIATINY